MNISIVFGVCPVKDAQEEKKGNHSRGGGYQIDPEVVKLIVSATKPADINIDVLTLK